MENISNNQIEMVNPHSLKFASFNPSGRTSPQALAKLRGEIERAGKIISPIIITKDGYIADGHRRTSIAKELGYSLVPTLREDYDLAELWSILNGGNMAVNRKNWMQAVREGMPIDCVPEKDRKVLEDLIRVMGKKGFEVLVDEGRGPSIITVAQYIARYCGDDSDKFVRKVINWFRKCNALRDAKMFVSTHCPVEVLIEAIEKEKPLRQYWGFAE